MGTIEDVSANRGNLELYSPNATQYGAKSPETFILMQNRMGIRIEYNIDQQTLQLWISPQAGKSFDYHDRNFSNRDDHCNLFDKIIIPGLQLKDFVKCDYDPFYSVIHFTNQQLNILSLYDQPIVVIWFEKPDVVDFKSDKADSLIERETKMFHIYHTDREKEFEFLALIGSGEGTFRHQLEPEKGRSVYARAELAGNQPLYITGELNKENVAGFIASVSNKPLDQMIEENNGLAIQASRYGKATLRNKPEMQKLLDLNRKVALSLQDEKGVMRSSSQYIYYLLWFRDGGMNVSHLASSGWVDPAKHQAKFQLLNPNITEDEPAGRFFGQLIGGRITKWEEDGLFYVIWTSFMHWTQTGDTTLISGQYLEAMEEGMEWLEQYCYDPDKAMFGRFHYCETPLSGSRGDGWDNAVGRPTWKWPSTYEDKSIVRSYDLYINNLCYACYHMLSAMTTGDKKIRYLGKAADLASGIRQLWLKDQVLPSYGELITDKSASLLASPYGMDQTDYLWSLSLPFFYPDYDSSLIVARKQLYRDITVKPRGTFLVSYLSVLRSLDTEFFSEDSIMLALDYLVPQCVKPGKYLPMPYTITEIIDVEDGHPFHDVRPIVFSIAPWLATINNLGVRRLPFGIALRSTKYLETIEDYQYLSGLTRFKYSGEGRISSIYINEKALEYSVQIPDAWLDKENNEVEVNMNAETDRANILVSSTVRLNDLVYKNDLPEYLITAYGRNILIFIDLVKTAIILDKNDNEMSFRQHTWNHFTFIEFEGSGDYTVRFK